MNLASKTESFTTFKACHCLHWDSLPVSGQSLVLCPISCSIKGMNTSGFISGLYGHGVSCWGHCLRPAFLRLFLSITFSHKEKNKFNLNSSKGGHLTICQVGLSFRGPQTIVIPKIFICLLIFMLLGMLLPPLRMHAVGFPEHVSKVCEFSVVFCNI